MTIGPSIPTPPAFRVWPRVRPNGKIIVIDKDGKIISEHDTREEADAALAALTTAAAGTNVEGEPLG